MRIAIMGPAYPFRGGIAAFTERLGLALQEAGHEVKVYTFIFQYPNFLFPGKTQYSEDPAPEQLDIEACIHSMNPANWYRVGRRMRLEAYDQIICAFWLPFFGPCFGTILRQAKTAKTEVVGLIHNMIPHESRPGDGPFTRYFVKPVDRYVALSESVLADIDQFDPQAPKAYSPHPLYDHYSEPVDRREALRWLGLAPEARYMLFFGLIRDYKGLDLLIDAFADERFRENNIHLLIAGEFYTDRKPFDAQIAHHPFRERIHLVAQFIPNEAVRYYFNASDLVVQPYRHATQSGITQIAYHFDKPMVVTKVGGLPELCPDGKVGYVVEPVPGAIAEGILRFFEQTDTAAMAKSIAKEKEKYSWEGFVEVVVGA